VAPFEKEFSASTLIVKGSNRDTAWFSMLDSEWPARKAALERQLWRGWTAEVVAFGGKPLKSRWLL